VFLFSEVDSRPLAAGQYGPEPTQREKEPAWRLTGTLLEAFGEGVREIVKELD